MKLDVTLGDLTKIGKSQKYTLSVDVEGGKLVVLKKQKDSQEDWNTFTHDKSERGPRARLHPALLGGAAWWRLGGVLGTPQWSEPPQELGTSLIPPCPPSPAADQVAAGAEQAGHRLREGEGQDAAQGLHLRQRPGAWYSEGVGTGWGGHRWSLRGWGLLAAAWGAGGLTACPPRSGRLSASCCS